uniref:Hyp7 n=1 Tax=Haemonchus placei TaxID=6290 RepID=A0A0N4VZQ3_HAEPC
LKAASKNNAVVEDPRNTDETEVEFPNTTPRPNTEEKNLETSPGSVVIKKTPADDGSFGNVYIYLNLVKDLSTKVKRAEEMKENIPKR